MINKVSFGSKDFNALLAEPPASARANTVAAANVYDTASDSFEKKKSFTGKVVGAAVKIGLVAAGLALLRGKIGAFKNVDLTNGIKGQEGILGKAKFAIAKAGDVCINAFKAIKAKIPFIGKKADQAAETVTK